MIEKTTLLEEPLEAFVELQRENVHINAPALDGGC